VMVWKIDCATSNKRRGVAAEIWEARVRARGLRSKPRTARLRSRQLWSAYNLQCILKVIYVDRLNNVSEGHQGKQLTDNPSRHILTVDTIT
jgi:hypothetical protein